MREAGLYSLLLEMRDALQEWADDNAEAIEYEEQHGLRTEGGVLPHTTSLLERVDAALELLARELNEENKHDDDS